MYWAIDSNGNHVRAGTSGADNQFLWCPVCRSRVHHRQGAYRRAHFAHFSGNSNRECELYQPGVTLTRPHGNYTITAHWSRPLAGGPSLKAPALVWQDGKPLSLSLFFRFPLLPADYAAALHIRSSLGQRIVQGNSLTTASFAHVPLNTPPARVTVTPGDLGLELQLNGILEQFREAGNYFRLTTSGGILEKPEVPLELGAEYILVTRRQLAPFSCPPGLQVVQERTEQDWTAYRLKLRNETKSQDADIDSVSSYLEKSVVAPRPKVSVVWPPPHRFDLDGAAIHAASVHQLVVRCAGGEPRFDSAASTVVRLDSIQNEIYRIEYDSNPLEAAIWVPGGNIQRLRFEGARLIYPDGVALLSGHQRTMLHSPDLTVLKDRSRQLHISVPAKGLWSRCLINGAPLNQEPSGVEITIPPPVRELDFGAFGFLYLADSEPQRPHKEKWGKDIEEAVCKLAGTEAFSQLETVQSKHALLRWAIDNKATYLLPMLFFKFPGENDRGI